MVDELRSMLAEQCHGCRWCECTGMQWPIGISLVKRIWPSSEQAGESSVGSRLRRTNNCDVRLAEIELDDGANSNRSFIHTV